MNKLHKSIYKQMKRKALNLEGTPSDDLKSYRKDQKRFASREFSYSNFEELITTIQSSRVVYLGDFHTFDQSSKNLERLTRTLAKRRDKFSIGVEFVHIENQIHIDDFLAKNITEIEFLELIDYRESWHFPWTHYRSFFDIARRYNLKVLALNSTGSLTQRDQYASHIISQFLQEDIENKLFVLFGELHIMPNKLPKRVQESSAKDLKQTIVHQNLDDIYWKLDIQNIQEDNQIVRFNSNEFSLQTSPPWIKYESMIYWYENICDDPEFDIHDYIFNSEILTLNNDVPENFVFFCQKICEVLGWDYLAEKDELEDFNLYDHQKLNLVFNKIGRIPKRSLSNFYKKLMEQGSAFRIPFGTNYYCSNYSVNRLSSLAGVHIQDLANKREDIHYEQVLMGSSQKEKFFFFLYQIAFSYFASKVFNPFRKCDLYQDIRQTYTKTQDISQKKNLRSVLDVIDWDGTLDLESILKKKSLFSLYEIAKKLGFYLGDILYDDFFIKKDKDTQEILKFITNNNYCESKFYLILRKLLPEKSYKKNKKRFF